MARIEEAFNRRLRDLFAELGARDREKGLAWVRHRAHLEALASAPTISHAYTQITTSILDRTRTFRNRRSSPACATPPRVHCDAGLGGLARWLRACGCEAFWRQDITDAELVQETQRLGGILLTTDSLLLERRPIARGEVSALWIPPTLKIQEQLLYLRAELDLPPPDSVETRCMRCGGELIAVGKESVRDRLPPRTYKWLDEFFECSRCHQLFWEGTHWQRISSAIREPSFR